MTAITELSAAEMIAAFQGGELSPVEAAEACLARIYELNDSVHAFCQINEKTTLAEARAAEARYKQGTATGLIDGVPVAVKDISLAAGWPNREGSKLNADDTPATVDAPAVAALKRHGMVTIGRTTTPELGWKGVTDSPMEGPTGNPYDPSRTSGGSSGGSATAVTLGMAPLALGTDAGGSIRIPAGFSGCFGHKPTHGLCPMSPPSSFAPLAHVGPLTRTVDDSARLMNLLAEPDARDSTLPICPNDFMAGLDAGVANMRIAYTRDFGVLEPDPEITTAVDAAAQQLATLGAEVETVDPIFDDPIDAFNLLFYGGAANALRGIGASDREHMDPGLIHVAEWAEQHSLLDLMQAFNVRAALTETMNLFHQRYDLLISPTLPIPAFTKDREVPEDWPHARWPSWTPFTYPFNLTGQPACSVPCGFTQSGLPIGLQIIGARHTDAVVLRAARAYEQAHPVAMTTPPQWPEDPS